MKYTELYCEFTVNNTMNCVIYYTANCNMNYTVNSTKANNAYKLCDS